MCERGVAYLVHVTCVPAVLVRQVIGLGVLVLLCGTVRHDDRKWEQVHQSGAVRKWIGSLWYACDDLKLLGWPQGYMILRF